MDKTLKVCCECTFLSPHVIKLIEEKKNAKYVCETCIKDKHDNWANQPAAIFMCPEPHPVSGSKYLAVIGRPMLLDDGVNLVYTNGQSAVDTPIAGIIAKNGDIIYSRFRHDYRTSEDGTVTIDGGRDYTKTTCTDTTIRNPSGDIIARWGQTVSLQIVEDQLQVVEAVLE
jgi:hypothetical protein